MSFTDPAPGATVGRTDEGVDWSGVRSIRSVAAGTITNVYQRLGGFGQTIIERLRSGQDVYYAEETAGTHSTVAPGQSVRQGQTIASGGTGGVIEAGFWDSSTGRAQGAPGYVEGKSTSAGLRFRGMIPGLAYGGTRPGGQPAGSSDSSGGTGGGAQTIFDKWKQLRDSPRSAPPGTKSPFKWWLASFTSNWDNLGVSGVGGGTPPDASTANIPSSGKTYGQISYGQVAAIAKQHGWSAQEADVWFGSLIPSESNGTITDTNPSSHAYGIAQGITGPSWYYRYGGNPNTVTGQLTAMANYIAQRYGSPSVAWAFHKRNNWY